MSVAAAAAAAAAATVSVSGTEDKQNIHTRSPRRLQTDQYVIAVSQSVVHTVTCLPGYMPIDSDLPATNQLTVSSVVSRLRHRLTRVSARFALCVSDNLFRRVSTESAVYNICPRML